MQTRNQFTGPVWAGGRVKGKVNKTTSESTPQSMKPALRLLSVPGMCSSDAHGRKLALNDINAHASQLHKPLSRRIKSKLKTIDLQPPMLSSPGPWWRDYRRLLESVFFISAQRPLISFFVSLMRHICHDMVKNNSAPECTENF